MTAGRERTRNEIEFRNYRKYGTESTIQYDLKAAAAEPLPASKTEEQPVSTPAQPSPKQPAANDPFSVPTAPPPPPPQL